MNKLTTGLLAGLAATAPMTVFMRAAHLQLPFHERDPLPPEKITSRIAHLFGKGVIPRRRSWQAKTYASHFAFGATAGAAYSGLLARAPGSPLLKGMLFGTGVWLVSYFAALPAVGLHKPAHREPARRNALMWVAHLVWGGVLGTLSDKQSRF